MAGPVPFFPRNPPDAPVSVLLPMRIENTMSQKSHAHVCSFSIASESNAVIANEAVGYNAHLAGVRVHAVDLVWHDGRDAEVVQEPISVQYAQYLTHVDS